LTVKKNFFNAKKIRGRKVHERKARALCEFKVSL